MRALTLVGSLLLLMSAQAMAAPDDQPFPMRQAEADRKAAAAERFHQYLLRETLDPNQEQYDTRFVELDIDFAIGGDPLAATEPQFAATIVDNVVVVGAALQQLTIHVQALATGDDNRRTQTTR